MLDFSREQITEYGAGVSRVEVQEKIQAEFARTKTWGSPSF
jgi:hypothetical protein